VSVPRSNSSEFARLAAGGSRIRTIGPALESSRRLTLVRPSNPGARDRQKCGNAGATLAVAAADRGSLCLDRRGHARARVSTQDLTMPNAQPANRRKGTGARWDGYSAL
jgi:hypothetical protein